MERELLDRAAELFAVRGFASTSLQDIADAAKVGRTTLYHYFRSKDDFLTALVEDVSVQPSRQLRAIREQSGIAPGEQLRLAVRTLLGWVLQRPFRFRVLVRDEMNLPAAILRKHEAAKRAVLDEISAIVDAGIAAGAFRPMPASVVALSLIGMCNWTAWWFNPKAKMTADEVGAMVSEMAVSAVQREPGLRGDNSPESALRAIRSNLDHLERIVTLRDG